MPTHAFARPPAVGAWHGRGKRTGVYGAYLLACLEEGTENLQSVCKLGTGFSEAQLAEFHALLAPTAVAKAPHYYAVSPDPRVTPDVWFTPTAVWEARRARSRSRAAGGCGD